MECDVINRILNEEDLFDCIKRKSKLTYEVNVGNVIIGGNNPIVVQSMALGGSGDANKDAHEVLELAKAGSELVRVAVNSEQAIKNIPYIRDVLVDNGFDHKMIIGCGQYEIARLVKEYPECASALGKIRINPGNIGFGNKRDKNFEDVIEFAIKYDIPIRIGVNWGSLDKYLASKLMNDNALLSNPKPDYIVLQKALVISAVTSAKRAEEIGLSKNKIVISCKTSKIQDLIPVYTVLSNVCNYPLHLGLTEAGSGIKGVVGSVAGISYLLLNGIGDTIRVSLTQQPGESRTTEVKLCQEILQSIGLKNFNAQVTSCPGCNRTNPKYFHQLVKDVNDYIADRMPVWRNTNPGAKDMVVAVMGCIVNGPGESKHANLGISLPGYGERPVAAVYQDGEKLCTLEGKNIFEQFVSIIENYVSVNYQ
ncbi:flavodoxin-dependent (E)-4-hydroxy-3-methylbut-2-enyl-diphosphate synthase [Ehrlichia canis]|uniref:4-hydroxy-3-methylbut-2-en-1-yl diphosphate synthase (flavodoxin) n=1 Tax=Ehrlichia canis (strain Jake) TaxID=269484 RepID=ISPG_EHRCJ|nr:flavodoxin-dependent (E)-4-hydroxy-3-methylbut-2-enyl-diphosphate synthase [Ehrlichia canis]Q3YRZ7.1 RecName: Full=4-hydroxy-3-methylbut-2-en-1-yl diphosphate synthase (flavodoxin); AltName: Full=1-hydroxy-2-methyl-2-(E)-butenyl 4-diphosphate synthase [Ehrlichia canis str. Jake]AAZ68508.1 4-hydroxy-3-methylbut-2-en-1-yl diphosphate synthase [Ehrlichia canis str. Jake]AUO54747.1 4-hydroxy-3-methylbut-2-en-1-yl diphosphate synthase (flavodoxin) [Ehrlichia canis]UKC53176.1 ispG [Ehrlichia canis